MPITEIESHHDFSLAVHIDAGISIVAFTSKSHDASILALSKMEQLSQSYSSLARFYNIDAFKYERLAIDSEITTLPSFLFFCEGECVGKVEGLRFKLVEEYVKRGLSVV